MQEYSSLPLRLCLTQDEAPCQASSDSRWSCKQLSLLNRDISISVGLCKQKQQKTFSCFKIIQYKNFIATATIIDSILQHHCNTIVSCLVWMEHSTAELYERRATSKLMKNNLHSNTARRQRNGAKTGVKNLVNNENKTLFIHWGRSGKWNLGANQGEVEAAKGEGTQRKDNRKQLGRGAGWQEEGR